MTGNDADTLEARIAVLAAKVAQHDGTNLASLMAEACEPELVEFGASLQGAGYAKGDAVARNCYGVMLDLIRPHQDTVSVLDFGCGAGGFYDHIQGSGHSGIDYTGLDLSEIALELARQNHPGVPFISVDVLAADEDLGQYDYIVMNGIFNWRGELPYDEMVAYFEALLATVYGHCRIGLAFNAMSEHVDWKRDDLFHLPLDRMAAFVIPHLTRHVSIRADYGAYEYTTYLFREPYAS